MPNALANETSPYLLQHRDNPVNWVPWSDAAFEEARRRDVPVFLSVGYSTCHWCHVMEHESFENETVAAVMNRHFVCVKVDREERPDIDATYMAFVQATTGQGGWPMSVWLTPDGEPVFGGTYFPPGDRGGRPGFTRVCEELGRLWKEDRARIEESAGRMMNHLRKESTVDAVVQGLPGEKVFGDFVDRCESMFDPEWGGWGGAPKFPRPVVPRLLLQLADRFGAGSDEGGACLQMVERTLKLMAAGGMHDQLGGGFHRYSVDRYWHVPHYEKMLYDQAQLALLYLEAWQATGSAEWREVAEGVFTYLLRDMRDSGGAFHAAEDADSVEGDALQPPESPKIEGAYWTWRGAEIHELLEPRAAALFCTAYGVTEEGNARPESDPHGELEGRNTLYRAASDEVLAGRFEMEVGEVRESLAASAGLLLKRRSGRHRPHRDDKIISAWNGLLIAALARGARLLDRTDLKDAAADAAGFLKRELWSDEDGLARSWRGTRGDAAGFAIDHACVIRGLIELGALDAGWLDWALKLQREMDERFWDPERVGYVMRAELEGRELMTVLEDYDGAEPAATHVAADNLLDLAALTGDDGYAKRAEAIVRAGSRRMETQGFACPVLIGAYDRLLRGVVKMDVRGELPESIREKARRTFMPRSVWVRSEGPGEVVACEGEACRPWPV
ncbi:thioredoxin domain-containing protein [Haloferula sp. A504]|uniref:thioredoxin domain-containing protein n=1 Tax=Haloferula sp. A504 TaxID=3373601 RepID=UPI0031C7B9F3|nr:thioredoxin domain-containing protein [Verrucomicrobiaceae bacterium E54]